jgi:hypothetical protein
MAWFELSAQGRGPLLPAAKFLISESTQQQHQRLRTRRRLPPTHLLPISLENNTYNALELVLRAAQLRVACPT